MDTWRTFGKSDSGYYNEDVCDHQLHFSEFLEAAKKHASEVKLESSKYHPSATVNREEERKKSKKSWKSSLFFWSKSKKNVEPRNESTHGTTGPSIPKHKRGFASGPVFRNGERVVPANRSGKPASGPIASFFSSSRKEEVEIPYVCLDQIDHPRNVKDFGPIYLVT